MAPQIVLLLSFVVCVICILLSLLAGKKKKVKNIVLPVAETVFPVSANIQTPVFYDAIEGECSGKRIKLSGIKWQCKNYKNKIGEYVFYPVSPKGYSLANVSVKVNVVDTECITETEENFKITSASVCNNTPKTFAVYDLTGCNLFSEMPVTQKYVITDDNVRILGGYIQEYRVSADTVLTAGTVGFLVVENGASVTLKDKAEVLTLVVKSAKTIDISNYNGNITDIVQEQQTVVEYIAASANQMSRYSLPDNAVRIVTDGREYCGVIVDIFSDTNYIAVDKGTPVEKIPFPEKLKVLIGGGERELAVKWCCDDYNADGVYEFKPEFEGYAVTDCAEKCSIKVIAADNGEVKCKILSLPENTVLTEKIASAVLTLNAACTYGDEDFNIVIDNAVFVLDEAVASYKLDKSSVEAVLNVDDTEIQAEFADADVYKNNELFVDSLKIKIDADKTGRITITDVAGIQTFASDISEIGRINICGSNPEIVIESPYVTINGDISISNVEGIASVNVFPRYINKLRYSETVAENVAINGVMASDYIEREPLQIKKAFFANGIPVIIRQEDDGETYAYRASDLKKLSSAITCGAAFGGSYKNGLESTNITFESGVLFDFYGGSEQGNVYGICYSCVSGGLTNNSWYGGCSSADYCEKTITVFEQGAIKRDWVGGAANGSVGVPGKIYADSEYSVEMYFFDGIFTNIMYGNKSDEGKDLYGNIKFEMFGGIGLYHECGTCKGLDARIYGNVNVWIYGGTVEKQFKQCKCVEGYTRIKAYRNVNICGAPENKFPFTLSCNNRFYYSFFDNDFKLSYREYKRDISVPYSTEGDEGKLVVRFPEIKVPNQTKDNVRIASYTGDGMILTFPDGKVMIIDAPLPFAWESWNRDIEALGIEHIDYFLLTHYHGDHFGCLPKLLETHTIGTFLLPDENISSPSVEGVIPEDAKIVRVNMYDTITVGEGDKSVKITFLNPPFFAKKVMVADNHNPFGLCAVFEFGTSKLMLDADTYDENEAAWIYECPELISGIDVIKPGHHGITTSSRYDFFRVVDPKYVCITNLREYGCHQNNTIYMLENVNKMPADRIFSTGRHGMIKATLNGKKGEATVVTEYVEQ